MNVGAACGAGGVKGAVWGAAKVMGAAHGTTEVSEAADKGATWGQAVGPLASIPGVV
jgi:hypothetical protein